LIINLLYYYNFIKTILINTKININYQIIKKNLIISRKIVMRKLLNLMIKINKNIIIPNNK